MKLNIVIAEAALELVPRDLWRDPPVVSDSRRRGIDPGKLLLDRSFHHRAMLRLEDGEKRGRPDLVHATLLSVTCAPLYLDGHAKVFVHTHGDTVIEIAERTRIPKSYLRFRGLMEQTLVERPRTGLLRVSTAEFRDLTKALRSDEVVGLTTRGRAMSLEELAEVLTAKKSPTVVVGGFAHGHFAPRTADAVDDLVKIDEHHLDAHVVAARVLYEVEKRFARTND